MGERGGGGDDGRSEEEEEDKPWSYKAITRNPFKKDDTIFFLLLG